MSGFVIHNVFIDSAFTGFRGVTKIDLRHFIAVEFPAMLQIEQKSHGVRDHSKPESFNPAAAQSNLI